MGAARHATMTDPNPNLISRPRKGIYSHFNAAGEHVADERWQLFRDQDWMRADSEITRPPAFGEARTESHSVEWQADRAGWSLSSLVIHTARNALRREARYNVIGVGETAELDACWQAGGQVGRLRMAWSRTTAPLTASPLSLIAPLRAESQQHLTAVILGALGFEPHWDTLGRQSLGQKNRATPLGMRSAFGYALRGAVDAEVWVDATDLPLTCEYRDGSRVLLTGVSAG